MRFAEKAFCLKDGRKALLRSPEPEDAAALLHCFRQCAGETSYLLTTPEEVRRTIDGERAFIENLDASETDCMLLCFVEGALAGNCHISRKTHLKNRHRGTVAIALLKEYWGLGIGTAMFREMIAIAEGWGLMQLELEFIEGNDRGKALYEKMGFVTVAEHPNAICLPDGTLLKEFTMIRPL